MKETRYFYVPNAAELQELPEEEAQHALRVLRLKEGDEMMLMDGCGSFYRSVVSMISNKHCFYSITERLPQLPQWKGHFHLAIAPTKLMERMEWMTEKATEIGIDQLTFLDCQFSQRRILKIPRINKIIVSAAKQSRKAWMPVTDEITSFRQFIEQPRKGQKYIAHCYEEVNRTFLFDELKTIPTDEDITVLIGPEGDFSIDEVNFALTHGYVSVHLGESRLRTETAGLTAVMMMHLR